MIKLTKLNKVYYDLALREIADCNLNVHGKGILRNFLKQMKKLEIADGCLPISVMMCIALEYVGYKPLLCIGKVKVGEQEFYHAWVEIDEKVFDIAILGNTLYNADKKFLFNGTIINVQLNKSYEQTNIKYKKWVFDKDFNRAAIIQAMGWSYKKYCDGLPVLWDYLQDGIDTNTDLNKLKNIADQHIIGDKQGYQGVLLVPQHNLLNVNRAIK